MLVQVWGRLPWFCLSSVSARTETQLIRFVLAGPAVVGQGSCPPHHCPWGWLPQRLGKSTFQVSLHGSEDKEAACLQPLQEGQGCAAGEADWCFG